APRGVKRREKKPNPLARTPIHIAVVIEEFPVTVGRSVVRFISVSRSTSYQLLIIRAPAVIKVLPIIVAKNNPRLDRKGVFVKYNANINPASTGSTFA